MQGPVERPNHPFTGLVFVHTERSAETGLGAAHLRRVRLVDHRVRHQARSDGRDARAPQRDRLPPYDCLSPGLMDYIATYTAKASGVLKA